MPFVTVSSLPSTNKFIGFFVASVIHLILVWQLCQPVVELVDLLYFPALSEVPRVDEDISVWNLTGKPVQLAVGVTHAHKAYRCGLEAEGMHL